MYRNREDVIAFRLFAIQEIEKIPSQELEESNRIEHNNHVLNSVDFDRRLISRQVQALSNVITEPSAFFYSLNVYFDNLRFQFKKDYLDRRITSQGA